MPLQIIIVGAGIAGLAAAIALGQNGHTVDVYEKSSFSKEVGAALILSSTAHRALKSWNMDLSGMRPVVCHRGELYKDSPTRSKPAHIWMDWDNRSKELDVKYQMLFLHRVDAHNLLRETAESLPTVTIHLSKPVTAVDPSLGTITLSSGERITGDLIIGSDGIHSSLIETIEPGLIPQKQGRHAYRFMIPLSGALADESCRNFLEAWEWNKVISVFFDNTGKRTLIMYPCRGGELINLATFIDSDSDEINLDEDSWSNPATLDDLIKVMDGYPEELKELAKLGQDVKVWDSALRDCPRTFIKDRLVLIGDSAHPMQPTWAAGAGTGIEDAAALGVLFDKDLKREDVSERLKVYNQARYERGVTIKYASENSPDLIQKSKMKLDELVPGAIFPEDMAKYLWQEDVVERCEGLLKDINEKNIWK